MANWTFDPSQYEEKDFSIIPVGDYRVRIADVVEKKFNSGNEGYEITLDVSGFQSRLWYYLVLNPNEVQKTNQRIGDFFRSFGITGNQLGTGKQWIGLVGACRVKHEEYNGNMSAKVAYVLDPKRAEKLEPWKEPGRAAAAPAPQQQVDIPADLPFA